MTYSKLTYEPTENNALTGSRKKTTVADIADRDVFQRLIESNRCINKLKAYKRRLKLELCLNDLQALGRGFCKKPTHKEEKVKEEKGWDNFIHIF